jgi:hypothetical protein
MVHRRQNVRILRLFCKNWINRRIEEEEEEAKDPKCKSPRPIMY